MQTLWPYRALETLTFQKFSSVDTLIYMKNLNGIREYGEEIIYFKGPRNYNELIDMAMEI